MRTHDSPELPPLVKEVALKDALLKEGFDLPDGCGNVKLFLPGGDVFVLEYQIVVSKEKLGKLGRALARVGEGNLD